MKKFLKKAVLLLITVLFACGGTACGKEWWEDSKKLSVEFSEPQALH